MDYAKIMENAFGYTKEGVLVRGGQWVKLILALILLTIPLSGYIMRIYRGATPAPEVDSWGRLFIDGLKLLVLGIVYAIPIIIVWIIAYAGLITALLSGKLMSKAGPAGFAGMGLQPAIGLIALLYILEIIIAILLPIAAIRLARTNSFAAAFNIGAILEYIGKIGWLSYILALILIAIVVGIPVFILAFIIAIAVYLISSSFIAAILAVIVIFFIILPPIQVFQARYITQVYDSVVPAE